MTCKIYEIKQLQESWRKIWDYLSKDFINSNLRIPIQKIYQTYENELCFCKSSDKIIMSRFISMSSPSHHDILWTKDGVNKGQKGFISKKEDTTSFSIIIAFSSIRIYGWLWTLETVNSEVMKYYYHNLCSIMNQESNEHSKRSLLVWDNAQVHKSKALKDFILKAKMKLLTITSYSPWLNPTEQLIGWIKARVRNEINSGRYVYLALLI